MLSIQADETDYVKAGQPLVRLDPADAQVALDQAEAQLAQAVREVRTSFSADATLQAQVALRQADAARLQGDVARAQDDLSRRRPLVATGAVGREEFSHAEAQLASAKSALAAAQSAVTAARDQLASNRTLTEGTSVEEHPNVQRAAARVREAYLGLRRVDLPAPVDGYVARRSVQLGQRVQAGAPLMALVPLDQLWVDANFKEVQLRQLRIGQPATLVADVYGKQVEYHGQVTGLGAAPARRSRCCRRRTPPATGSRWCSACRCASRSIRRSWRRIRCASACRWTSRSMSASRAARCSPMRRAVRR